MASMAGKQRQNLDAPATKRDVLGFATKKDLLESAEATKQDILELKAATKRDILDSAKATKKDILAVAATKRDIFESVEAAKKEVLTTTRQEMENLAEIMNTSSQGIQDQLDRLNMNVDRLLEIGTKNTQEFIMHEHGETAHEGIRGRVGNLENRVTVLETKPA